MSIPLFFHSISYSMRYLYKTGTCKHHCHISGFLGPRHSLSQMELKHCVAARTVNPPHPHRRRRRQVHSRSLHSVAPSDAFHSPGMKRPSERVVHKLTGRAAQTATATALSRYLFAFSPSSVLLLTRTHALLPPSLHSFIPHPPISPMFVLQKYLSSSAAAPSISVLYGVGRQFPGYLLLTYICGVPL